ncbi:hypothetical protein MBELCI_2452 [Limimaricola cinnabarinus LL-001]|uniref:Uncharacterized protein n=1 Tax=Limimaricola cinnabarinus LL-001 TaxID=1337093 RepID=U2Z4S9_9RHOB|nr:hypothetical protein MBELCI_2452 [Limimaricola cinnabarinus LL-001]
MGPGADQPRALIAERRHLDLQHALAGGGAIAEDLEDQAGPIEDLYLPFLFEISLLHRADMAVDQHQLDLVGLQPLLQLFDLAGAEQHAGVALGQAHDLGTEHVKARQRIGQRHGLGQRGRGSRRLLSFLISGWITQVRVSGASGM